MNNPFSTKELLDGLKKSLLAKAYIAIGYVPALPILTVLNGKLCMKVPFLRYKVTGVVDQTLVYPVKYVVTVTIPDNNIVAFENLEVNSIFSQIDFNRPIGTFRHEGIKQLNKEAYKAARQQLYTAYDKKIASILENKADEENEQDFANLLDLLLEPSIKPFYFAIDKEFASKHLKG